MRRARGIFATAIFSLAVLSGLGAAPSRHLLVLASYQRDMGWSAGMQAGIEAAIAETKATRNLGAIDILVEYMDTKRHTEAAWLESFATSLSIHYRDDQPAVIIASDNPALSFLLDKGKRIFPGVPVVFCGIDDWDPATIRAAGNVTGVVEVPDYRATMEAARTLFPTRKKVYLVADTSSSGRGMVSDFRATVEGFFPGFHFEEIPPLVFADIGSWAEGLDRDAIIFFVNYTVDASGQTRQPAEVVDALSVSGLPIFTSHDAFMTAGVLGGRLVTSEGQGRAAAALALRVLEGEKPSAIPLDWAGANSFRFSWTELKRFGLPLSRLPPSAVIVGRPEPYFVRKPWAAAVLTSVAAILAAVVIFLVVSVLFQRRSRRSIEASERKFRGLFDVMEQGAVYLDTQGRMTSFNDSAARILGLVQDDIMARRGDEDGRPTVHRDGSPMPADEDPGLRALRSGTRETSLFGIHNPVTGQRVWVVATAVPEFMSGEKKPFRVFVTFADITALKDAEERLAEQAGELNRKNEELERFAYTVSHDLKSPLVTIKGFLSFVEKDIAEGRTEGIGPDLSRISRAADHMEDLLGDILELSRIGRKVNPPQRFSMGEVVAQALDNLGGAIAASGAKVELPESWPEFWGDRLRVTEIWQNLVENAIKYSGGKEPCIELGWKQGTGEHVFFVADKGIGIEPAYAETVFGLFNKLDPKSPGTGVGLALVRRIVDVAGGRTWVESGGRGLGSTFFFTLPDPKAG